MVKVELWGHFFTQMFSKGCCHYIFMIEIKEKNFKAPAVSDLKWGNMLPCDWGTNMMRPDWWKTIYLREKMTKICNSSTLKKIFQSTAYGKIIRISSSLEEIIEFLEIK